MATLNAVVLPAKALKNGRHKVRISVAHNGEVRYINTDIILDNINEFKNGSIRKRTDSQYLNTKLRNLLNKYSQSLDELESVSCFTCSELVTLLKTGRQTKHITFRQAYEELGETRLISNSTRKAYRQSLNTWEEYIGDIPIAAVTHIAVLKYVKALRTKNRVKDSTIEQYVSKLNALLNYVVKCGYIKIDRNPFMELELKKSRPRDCWLTVDEIRRIRDYETNKTKMSYYRDIFMLSYYLGGINAVDLFNIDFSGKTIRYVRQKTRNKLDETVEFAIPKEASEIVSRLVGKDGKLSSSAHISIYISRWMRKLGEEVGIPNLIYYSARKSFAQHANELGIRESVIDYILGHSLGKSSDRSSCLFHYVYVSPQMATDAIRAVLDNLAEK